MTGKGNTNDDKTIIEIFYQKLIEVEVVQIVNAKQ